MLLTVPNGLQNTKTSPGSPARPFFALRRGRARPSTPSQTHSGSLALQAAQLRYEETSYFWWPCTASSFQSCLHGTAGHRYTSSFTGPASGHSSASRSPRGRDRHIDL